MASSPAGITSPTPSARAVGPHSNALLIFLLWDGMVIPSPAKSLTILTVMLSDRAGVMCGVVAMVRWYNCL